MRKQSQFHIVAVAALLSLLLVVPAQAYEALSGPTGVLKYKQGEAFEGYTLLTPNIATKTWLVDMNGNVVHEWTSKYTAGLHAELLPNGNLLRAGNLGKDRPCRFGGSGGIIQEFSWTENSSGNIS